MFICLDCGYVFETPRRWAERHGLDTPPYEELSGCPKCYGDYSDAYECDCCGEYIDEDCAMTEDGLRLCDECYADMELEGED